METQQFHLKWNNHSLNTLSSFQHLLDTNTLVDVSLTCSNGKTVTAHRMVLAACSDYFYRLFKDLPEKHPVIVFKDAGEEIVRDLLLFMYRGEVEVQEAYLNDFLKFADTLQVKGLSQSDREEQAKNNNNNSIRKDATPLSLVKTTPSSSSNTPTPLTAAPPVTSLPQPPMSDLAKTYLAGLSKFPPIFPHMPAAESLSASGLGGASGGHHDLFGNLASPNLYRALQKKYPDNPVLLKQMPFLKRMFGDNPDIISALYPPTSQHNDDSDSAGDRDGGRVTPPMPSCARTPNDENGLERPLAADSPYPPSNTGSLSDGRSPDKDKKDPEGGRGGSKNSGRGSRLERMIAAEYKIMSEFSDHPSEMLPVMTPELMKSRRTHSLQLAIAEIMHNRASVQSAATKYHIPRETLRRHYQRYLKAMGIQKKRESGSTTPTGTGTPPSSIRPSNNNNSKEASGLPPVSQSSLSGFAAAAAAAAAMAAGAANEDNSNGFSSLMDIGAAYGIWNPEDPEFKAKRARLEKEQAAAAASMVASAAMAMQDKDDKEKLVIDEDDDEEEEEPLSPGGPEDDVTPTPPTGLGPTGGPSANEPMALDTETKPTATSSTPMETSA